MEPSPPVRPFVQVASSGGRVRLLAHSPSRALAEAWAAHVRRAYGFVDQVLVAHAPEPGQLRFVAGWQRRGRRWSEAEPPRLRTRFVELGEERRDDVEGPPSRVR